MQHIVLQNVLPPLSLGEAWREGISLPSVGYAKGESHAEAAMRREQTIRLRAGALLSLATVVAMLLTSCAPSTPQGSAGGGSSGRPATVKRVTAAIMGNATTFTT